MKKQLLRGVVVLLSLAFLVVPALATVSLAPNEKGDMMIYPLYYGVNGIDTSFTVINTSNTQCTVAKVVLRSHVYSLEVLDFLIYLTPNDVFKAKIYFENGEAYLDSDDDSLLIGNDLSGLLTAADYLPFKLTPPDEICADVDVAANDSQFMGYIEVFESAAFPLGGLCVKNGNGVVDKEDLFNYYWGLSTVHAEVWETANILTGFAELGIPGWEYLVYKPTVLKDYDQNQRISVGDETILGVQNQGGGICVIESVLSKNNLVIPYYNDGGNATLAYLNFPTKLMPCEAGILGEPRGPYFSQFSDDYAPTYSVQIYDMEENSPSEVGCYHSPCNPDDIKDLPDEIAFINDWSKATYSEGWTRVVLGGDSVTCPSTGLAALNTLVYDGAPVIGLILELTTDSEGVTSMALMPPAYDFGGVTCNGASEVDGAFQLGFPYCNLGG